MQNTVVTKKLVWWAYQHFQLLKLSNTENVANVSSRKCSPQLIKEVIIAKNAKQKMSETKKTKPEHRALQHTEKKTEVQKATTKTKDSCASDEEAACLYCSEAWVTSVSYPIASNMPT